MDAADSESDLAGNFPSEARFAPTQWSVVVSACARLEPETAREALERLCRTYWPPLYAFVRRQGQSPHDAQDLTQAFFEKLITRDYLLAVDSNRGRFRSFLLASLKHFLANERDKARAQKRGGGQRLIPIITADSETQYGVEPVDHLSPDKVFERRWAMSLLERALGRLKHEYTAQGKGELFEKIKNTLTEGRAAGSYAALSESLGLSEAAIKMAVHRLRQRYRLALRELVAETVSDPSETEDELRQVMRALTG